MGEYWGVGMRFVSSRESLISCKRKEQHFCNCYPRSSLWRPLVGTHQNSGVPFAKLLLCVVSLPDKWSAFLFQGKCGWTWFRKPNLETWSSVVVKRLSLLWSRSTVLELM